MGGEVALLGCCLTASKAQSVPLGSYSLQRFEDQRLRLPEAVRPAYKRVAAMASARMWAKRFRGRFAGGHGRIRCKTDVGVQGIRDKARSEFP